MIGGPGRYRLTNIRVTEFSDDETALSGLAPLIEKSYYAGKSDQTSDEWMCNTISAFAAVFIVM